MTAIDRAEARRQVETIQQHAGLPGLDERRTASNADRRAAGQEDFGQGQRAVVVGRQVDAAPRSRSGLEQSRAADSRRSGPARCAENAGEATAINSAGPPLS